MQARYLLDGDEFVDVPPAVFNSLPIWEQLNTREHKVIRKVTECPTDRSRVHVRTEGKHWCCPAVYEFTELVTGA